MNRPLRWSAAATALVLSLQACARASASPRGPSPQAAGEEAGARPGGRPGGAQQPRPYRDVITAAAVTRQGLFRVHRVDDKVYFEIPTSELGKEMLLIGRTVESTLQSPGTFSTGGPRLIVEWERSGNRVILREKSYEVVADTADAIYRQVAGFRRGAILGVFDVAAQSPDSAAVVDVTELFLSSVPELAPIEGIQRNKSWVEGVWAFPRNVNVEVTQTGQGRPPATPGQGGPPGPPAGGPGAQARPASQTQRVHYSLLALPEQPMMPRWQDERVGFISSSSFDFSRPEQKAKEVSFIHRFRLEKQNPSAQVSDPVQPIVYWIDPATPDWLKPWIVKGVNAWQPVFAGAGFSNAIVGRVAPTAQQDPDFSLFDARHSAIYWRPSTVANATGGQIVDPRSGEILKGEVNMYHNVMELLKNWYFIQVGPLDPRARSLPLADSLMGRLVEYVVTHEVGHSIGFPHNMKASAMYPADSLRSAAFLERMGGHVATLMDYSRFNYVAQPEDNIPVHLLVPRVGPYDRFALHWGYAPIPGARTPDEELPTLDAWAREQDRTPWLRFSTPGISSDPEDQTEAVGDADAVKSTTLGMRNLKRVAEMLLPVAEKPGQSYEEMETLYGQAVAQWGRYMGHVASIVGGAYTQEKYGTGPRFQPLEKSRQREALRYLGEEAFQVPEMFLDAHVLRRLEPEGAVARFRTQQSRVLTSLLSQARLERLMEFEALENGDAPAYTLADLMADLRQGVWGELSEGRVEVSVYRRNLQRAFLDAVDQRLHPTDAELNRTNNPAPPPWASDVRAVMRAELEDLDRLAQQAMGKAADPMTRVHLRDVRAEIARILDTGR